MERVKTKISQDDLDAVESKSDQMQVITQEAIDRFKEETEKRHQKNMQHLKNLLGVVRVLKV
jgi:hypothetical protein